MKNIIFGNSDFAYVFYESAVREGLDIEAFTVDREFISGEEYDHKPIIAFEDLSKIYCIEDCTIYLCVGYKHMNQLRKCLHQDIKNKGYIIGEFFHSSAFVHSAIKGEGNIALENTMIGSKTEIGDCNIFYPNSTVAHHSRVGNYNYFSISASIAGNTNIGSNCFFGNNSTTKDGINIRDSVLVGAGAYLGSDAYEEEVIVPAKSVVLSGYKSSDFF